MLVGANNAGKTSVISGLRLVAAMIPQMRRQETNIGGEVDGQALRGWRLTNAAVDALTSSAVGRTLKLKYKDGEKTLHVPLNVPIVTFRPGDNGLLVVGARLIVTAELRDGRPTALRITAGRNGFAPPM